MCATPEPHAPEPHPAPAPPGGVRPSVVPASVVPTPLAPFSRIGLLNELVGCMRAAAPGVRANIVPCSLHDLPFTEPPPLDTSVAIDRLQGVIGWPFIEMQSVCAELAARHFGGDRAIV